MNKVLLLAAVVLLSACEPEVDPRLEAFDVTEEVTRLVLDNGDGDILITATSDDHVRVEVEHLGEDSQAVSQVAGGILSLSTQCSTSEGPCTINYTLFVPERVEVDASTASGDIVLVGMGGAADLESASGTVEIDGFTADTLLLTLNQGPVLGNRLAAEEVVASSQSGTIDLTFDQRPLAVTAAAVDADVRFAVPAGEYALALSSDDGEITVDDVTDTPGAEHSLEATTASGDILIQGY